ncbi:MAG: CRTAC1 family protein [Acidobacteriota bacterium]
MTSRPRSASGAVAPMALGLAALLALGCGGSGGSGDTTDSGPVAAASGSAQAEAPAGDASDKPIFLERAAELGIDFRHWNGMTGDFVYAELMGSGVALFDYDNDGDLDVFTNQGHLLGKDKTPEDAFFPPPEGPSIDRLFRNEMTPGEPESLRFTDVTEAAGLRLDGYSMGVATGDIDNDGDIDLYVTEWEGGNRLLRNNGDGTFDDITATAGTADPRWTVAAAFFDADADGLLDLYVGNYLNFSLELNQVCVNEIGLREYCGPIAFKPVPDAFFRNRGDGRFEDATGDFNFLQPAAPVLGVVVGDWNVDGRPDLYLANDEYPNNLLIQQEDGRYTDEARFAGAAMNAEGHAEAGMGVTAGDVDNDGDEDLFVTHLDEETNTLYEAEPGALFADRTAVTGLGAASFNTTGFGTHFFDYDNDGRLDLFVANGAVQGIRERVAAGEKFPLAQTNQLFRNLGNKRFEETTAAGGPVFDLEEVSRGAGFGDLDNDGDTDIVLHNNAGPLRLMVNQVGQDAAWLGLRLIGQYGRDAIGAQVFLERPGDAQMRQVRTEGSYASANDPRLLFGLGDATEPAQIRVRWPDGIFESWSALDLGEYHTLRRGDGTPTTP